MTHSLKQQETRTWLAFQVMKKWTLSFKAKEDRDWTWKEEQVVLLPFIPWFKTDLHWWWAPPQQRLLLHLLCSMAATIARLHTDSCSSSRTISIPWLLMHLLCLMEATVQLKFSLVSSSNFITSAAALSNIVSAVSSSHISSVTVVSSSHISSVTVVSSH